jgi:hypothetical protein
LNRNITPLYNAGVEEQNKKIEIGKFDVSGNNGSFTMEIIAQKPKSFERMISKVQYDAGLVTLKKAN